MRAASASASLYLCLLLCTGCDGCDGCGEDTRVAELASTLGTVQRDFATRKERWQRAGAGAGFEIGDGLRTSARSRAELALMPAGRLRVEADTVVRFAAAPPQRGHAGSLELEAGAIELEATAADYEIKSDGVNALLTRGSRVRVRAGARATEFSVAVGRVLLEQNGATRELRAGSSFELEVGAALIEPSPKPKAETEAEVVAEPAASSKPAEPVQAADAQGFDLPPARADLELPAGESASIHDSSPPTHVRIAYADCPSFALEVVRSGGARVTRVRGHGSATAALPTGHFRYRVRCASSDDTFAARPAAHGRLHVVRDAATRKLPASPPAVTLAADGRHYTVRYENVPPQLSLRWPDAPKARSYALELRSDGRPLLRERSSTPSVTLAAGRVEEGTYAFRFEAEGMRSAEGTLKVVFDNTARVAYLAEPRERAFTSGGRVRLAGAALRGARVAVEGRTVPVHSQGRFDTHVELPAERSALAVRVQHAATGVHYFLRHAAAPGD